MHLRLTWYWPGTDLGLTWDWTATDMILTWDQPGTDLRMMWSLTEERNDPWLMSSFLFTEGLSLSPEPECLLFNLNKCLGCQPLRCQPRHRAFNCPVITYCETEKPPKPPKPAAPSVSPFIWVIVGVLLALFFLSLSAFFTVQYFRCLSDKIDYLSSVNKTKYFRLQLYNKVLRLTWDWPETDLREQTNKQTNKD